MNNWFTTHEKRAVGNTNTDGHVKCKIFYLYSFGNFQMASFIHESPHSFDYDACIMEWNLQNLTFNGVFNVRRTSTVLWVLIWYYIFRDINALKWVWINIKEIETRSTFSWQCHQSAATEILKFLSCPLHLSEVCSVLLLF